jgi:predicted ABC-class ATPase
MLVRTDNTDLMRDTESNALINVNKAAVNKDLQYKQRLAKEIENKETINKLQEEISNLRSDISTILNLLNSRGI